MLSKELTDDKAEVALSIPRLPKRFVMGRLVFSFNLHTYETQLLSNNIRLGL